MYVDGGQGRPNSSTAAHVTPPAGRGMHRFLRDGEGKMRLLCEPNPPLPRRETEDKRPLRWCERGGGGGGVQSKGKALFLCPFTLLASVQRAHLRSNKYFQRDHGRDGEAYGSRQAHALGKTEDSRYGGEKTKTRESTLIIIHSYDTCSSCVTWECMVCR